MTEKKAKYPWRGWKPGSAKEYDPNDLHFNPMHPPKGYPQDLLEAEWEEPEVITIVEKVDGKPRIKKIFHRKKGND